MFNHSHLCEWNNFLTHTHTGLNFSLNKKYARARNIIIFIQTAIFRRYYFYRIQIPAEDTKFSISSRYGMFNYNTIQKQRIIKYLKSSKK